MSDQANCRQCGKELSDSARFHGLCYDCWCARLRVLRGFYRPYVERLRTLLARRGIFTSPGTLAGLTETGRPLRPVRKAATSVIPLREDEYAVYLFRARGALFAFPDNGIGLRYVIPSADSVFMRQIAGLGQDANAHSSGSQCFLAAASDGIHVYALSDDGKIYHTNPSVPEPIPVSSRLELCREVWQSFFSDEQIRESAAWLNNRNGGIKNIDGDREYYDPTEKVFFWVSTDGNYYHGYDVSYLRLSKESVIDSSLRSELTLFRLWEKCKRGEIPLAAELEFAEEAPEDMAYDPPENFGYGFHYM